MEAALDMGSLSLGHPSMPTGYEDEPSRGEWGGPDADPSFRPHRAAISELERCYHLKSRWELALMRSIAEIERLGTYAEMGFESVPEFVCAHLGIGYWRACELVDVALSLEHLPQMRASFEAGKLSYDHLRALTQVAGPENEKALVEEAEGMSVADTFRLVRKITDVSKEDSVDARMRRWLDMTWDHDSRMLVLSGLLPEDAGAKFERTLDALARKMPDDPLWETQPTPMGIKRADALCALASESLAGSVTPQAAQVVVHIEAGKGPAELEDGPPISRETARRLCCDSVVRAVVHGSDGKPIGFGRTMRTVPKRMKIELKRRDRTCRWPVCRRTKLVDAHHIKPWDEEGETNYDNMVLFCEFHHYMVHEAGFRVVGEPPNITILPPRRKSLPAIRAGPPPVSEEARNWEKAGAGFGKVALAPG